MTTDPLRLFGSWFKEATLADQAQPDAMALATVSEAGVPSVRVVLLKGWSEKGFEFFTNTRSRKGVELAANPRAAITIHWPALGRQVRAGGSAAPLTRSEVAAYWATRPRESQAAASVSHQSQTIPSLEDLVEAQRQILAGDPARPLPLPEEWGGYRLEPDWLEFWESRPGRLHRRRLFSRVGSSWREELLAP